MRLLSPIVAGVNGTGRDTATVEAAAREAALHGRPLRLVHAYSWPPLGTALIPELAGPSLGTHRERAAEVLTEATRVVERTSPGVVLTAVSMAGRPSAVLRDQSRQAALLVVGSTGVRAAARSACPVLVVRGDARPGAPVVAGVNGSPASMGALTYAAEAACRRHAELVVLQAWNTGMSCSGPVTDAELALAAEIAGVTGRHPGLRLRWQVRRGPARRVLTYFSRNAQLVVVGDRGSGGFGSVTQHLIHQAACPTVVVRT